MIERELTVGRLGAVRNASANALGLEMTWEEPKEGIWLERREWYKR